MNTEDQGTFQGQAHDKNCEALLISPCQASG